MLAVFFFFSSRRRHTSYWRDWSSDVCSSDLIDAATGKPAEGAPPDDIDTVRVNNRLRSVIDAANGALTLMAPDPNRRYEAAQAVFKSRDAAVLPAVDKALAGETNTRVKTALTEARAAITLTSDASTTA